MPASLATVIAAADAMVREERMLRTSVMQRGAMMRVARLSKAH